MVITAILTIVLAGAAHAGAPAFASAEMSSSGEACLGQVCGNMDHKSMPVAECVAHCLKNGIETTGAAVLSFAGQILPILLAVFLGVIFVVAVAPLVGRKFRQRGDFAKLFLETSLRGVILLN